MLRYEINTSRFNKLLQVRKLSLSSLMEKKEKKDGKSKTEENDKTEEAGKTEEEQTTQAEEPKIIRQGLKKSKVMAISKNNTSVPEPEFNMLLERMGCTEEYLTAKQNVEILGDDYGLMENFMELLDKNSNTEVLKMIIKGFKQIESNRGKYDNLLKEIRKCDLQQMRVVENSKNEYSKFRNDIMHYNITAEFNVECYLFEDGVECVVTLDEKIRKYLHFGRSPRSCIVWVPKIFERMAELEGEDKEEYSIDTLTDALVEPITDALYLYSDIFVSEGYEEDYFDFLDNGVCIECSIGEGEPPLPYEFIKMDYEQMEEE